MNRAERVQSMHGASIMDELGDGRNNLAPTASHQTEVSFFLLVLSCRVKKSNYGKASEGMENIRVLFH